MVTLTKMPPKGGQDRIEHSVRLAKFRFTQACVMPSLLNAVRRIPVRTVERDVDRPAVETAPRSSRFKPPRLMHSLLPRPRLLQQIEGNLGAITLLLGPPGGGRTVLMSECHRHLADAGHRVCWLSLSYADNDQATLHRHLALAFELADDEPLEIPAGCNGFIDGAHWLDDVGAIDLLQHFALSVPDNSRIILAASQIKAQSLRSAELSGLIQVIGPSQLSMSNDEAAALLAGDYSRDQVSQLNAFVDGWPAGLRFLQRAPLFCSGYLQSPQNPPGLPEELADYFEAQICQNMTSPRLDALMELSVIHRFIPELIAALPDAVSNWRLIDELLREGWLIRYADPQQHWAQVHPALSLYLSTRLRRFDPLRYRELKHFVAHWLKDNGYPQEAVHHAAALDEPPLAAKLIEDAGAVALDLGKGPCVQLPEQIPAEQAGEFPLLFISQLYQRIRSGRLREARALFDQAWELTEGFTRVTSSARDQQVQSWAQLYLMVFQFLADIPMAPDQLRDMQREIDRLLVLAPVLAASWGSLLAYGLLDQRQFQAAVIAADSGLTLGPPEERPRISLFLLIHKAHALLALGRLNEAHQCAQRALDQALIDAGHNTYEWVAASLSRGLLHFLSGEDQRALDLLLPALACVPHTASWVSLYAESFAAAAAALTQQRARPPSSRCSPRPSCSPTSAVWPGSTP